MDTLMTPDEVAHRLRLSRRTVIGWLQAGRISGVKVGNRWRIRADQLDSLVQDSAGYREASEWLEADISGELPPYDWGPLGEPALQTVEIVAGEGLMIRKRSSVD
ncbi:helix-turn-helix domain-containing protein [bacterium]|nr:helix-turn-helix domain-containing protein [bacterium]